MDDYGDEVGLKNTLNHEVHVTRHQRVWRRLRALSCILRCCAFCACSCHCSCCCRRFRQRVSVVIFLCLEVYLFTPPVGDSKLRWLLPNFVTVFFLCQINFQTHSTNY